MTSKVSVVTKSIFLVSEVASRDTRRNRWNPIHTLIFYDPMVEGIIVGGVQHTGRLDMSLDDSSTRSIGEDPPQESIRNSLLRGLGNSD